MNLFLEMPRVDISIQDKLRALELLEAGVPVRGICKRFGVGKTCVYDLKQNKEKIVQISQRHPSALSRARPHVRHHYWELEFDILEEFRKRRRSGFPISELALNAIFERQWHIHHPGVDP